MGLESSWRCDVCGATVAQNEAVGWRKALVAPLEETAPVQPIDGMPVVAPEVVMAQACLCTKASCLTAFAKDQNTAKKT